MTNDPEGVYFFHIPKTAGVSVYKAIDAAYDPAEICPCWLWDDLIEIPLETLARYRVFRGHFYGFLEPFLGRQLRKFTILREPVDRTISYYYHIRNAEEHPNHADAQALSLREFCLDARTRYLVENYQAGYLASFVLAKDPRAMAGRFTAEEKQTHLFQAALEPATTGIAPSILLEAAREGLSRLGAVGICEHLDLSLERISRAIGRTLALPAEHQNVTPHRVPVEQLDAATLQTVEEITALDRFLYRQIADGSS